MSIPEKRRGSNFGDRAESMLPESIDAETTYHEKAEDGFRVFCEQRRPQNASVNCSWCVDIWEPTKRGGVDFASIGT